MKNKDNKVICVYDENGASISDKILEAFEIYLKQELLNKRNLINQEKGNNKVCK